MNPILIHTIRVGIVLTAGAVGYAVGRKVSKADSKKKVGKVTVINNPTLASKKAQASKKGTKKKKS